MGQPPTPPRVQHFFSPLVRIFLAQPPPLPGCSHLLLAFGENSPPPGGPAISLPSGRFFLGRSPGVQPSARIFFGTNFHPPGPNHCFLPLARKQFLESPPWGRAIFVTFGENVFGTPSSGSRHFSPFEEYFLGHPLGVQPFFLALC